MKMKNRLLSFILAFCLIVPIMFMLTACGGDEHKHTYEIKYNDTYHWQEPKCDDITDIKDKSAHIFENGKCNICDYVYDIEGEGEITKVSNTSELQTAIQNASDDDVIIIKSGIYAFDDLQTLIINKRLTLFGEGIQDAKLSNVIFSVSNSTKTHTMKAVFNNLSFEGTSQIQFNDIDHVDAEIVGLDESCLTIKNCVANVNNTSLSTLSHSAKGQFVSLSASYDLLLNLVMENNIIVTSHSIAGEDASPIVYGNGTLIQNATFKNNTFGSSEHSTARYAVKFGRRTDNTTIIFDNNVIYGATTASKDFYLLDLWQSGSNPYDNLEIVMKDNNVFGTAHTDKVLSLAYIENTVVAKTSGQLGSLTLSNNKVNNQVVDGTNINNSADITIE